MGDRGYQHDFSSGHAEAMFDVEGRERKARTMVAVLGEYFGGRLGELDLLDVGASTGIIDHYLAQHFRAVIGIDIDSAAIEHAQSTFPRQNLKFRVADALNLPFPDSSFDAVVCSQVYEHVPDAAKMMREIHRVLKPGGACYFAASNRLRLMEPHYQLPLLSVIPRPLAHLYMRLARKGSFYYERHFSYWGLKRLIRGFRVDDYTIKLISDPVSYGTDYMITPNSFRAKAAKAFVSCFYWASPGYVWILTKPSSPGAR